MRPPKPTTADGYIKTPSGLIVPPGYYSSHSHVAGTQRLLRSAYSTFQQDGFAYGLRLERDPETLVIRWAAKGGGLDDLINRAIADGEIGNVGISPLIFPQINGLMKRRQNLAYSASVTVTGRDGPTTRAANAIARFNDSPLGAVAALRQIIYQLDTYNRGAPIATVPLTYPLEQWDNEAMRIIPLDAERTRRPHSALEDPFPAEQPDKYYLEVDWNIRKTPVPYLPNPLDLEPTSNLEWPYWYRAQMDERDIWVLLHNSQILPILPAHSGTHGIGTSSIWICLGFLGEHVLAIDERYEALIDSPKNGILGIGGISQDAREVRNQIEHGDATDAPAITSNIPGRRPAAANLASVHDWTLITSPEQITFDHFRFRQSDAVPFLSRQAHFEDVLALAFDDNLSAIVIRQGVGHATQSEISSNNVAEGGVFAILQALEIALGAIYPRVSVHISKVNDRARMLQLALLDKFASAIAKLPVDTFTRVETRTIIDRDIMTIPATGSDQIQTDARPGSRAENDDQAQADARAESMQLIHHLNELILDDLAELDSLLDQMLALQPENQHYAALQSALRLTAEPLAIMPLQRDYPTLVLQRLKHLQQIMQDM